MANKINFTAEHKQKMMSLLGSMLLSGNLISGVMGTSLNAHDLVHNTSIKTLQNILLNLKKSVDAKESLDEWSMTEYQQREISKLKSQYDLVNLLIGYKKAQAEKDTNAAKLSEIKAKYDELKQSSLTPAEQMKALEDQMKELSSDEETLSPLSSAPVDGTLNTGQAGI